MHPVTYSWYGKYPHLLGDRCHKQTSYNSNFECLFLPLSFSCTYIPGKPDFYPTKNPFLSTLHIIKHTYISQKVWNLTWNYYTVQVLVKVQIQWLQLPGKLAMPWGGVQHLKRTSDHYNYDLKMNDSCAKNVT